MLVLFLRHADAEDRAASDFERRLTPKGLEQADRVGKFLVRAGIIPDLILSSPLVRAQQTAAGVSKRLDNLPVITAPWLACGMSPDVCFQELAALRNHESVLVVGHEPDFGHAIATLLGLPASTLRIRKASLTAIEARSFAPESGRLEFTIPSRLM